MSLRLALKRIPGAWITYRFFKLIYNQILSIILSFRFLSYVHQGHFYSPIPTLNGARSHIDTIEYDNKEQCYGIEINEDKQLRLLDELSQFYGELPFPETKNSSFRYYYTNEYFSYGDVIILYAMLRYCRPKRVIEIGSGYSSAAMLDVNDMYFDDCTQFTFVEPYPKRLSSLLRQDDLEKHILLNNPLQSIPNRVFLELLKNDFLIVDSSHVAKVGSDVLHIAFKILPILNSGVIIHFHDICWPFEYPQKWFLEGRAWNEAYLIRSFLQYNKAFRVMYFNSFMERFYQKEINMKMPLCLKSPGYSLWLLKL